MYRYKCSCGVVFDGESNSVNCPKCGAVNSTEGMGIIQIYRMGSPIGVAAGESIYIDKEAYGHIANTGTAKVVVPLGTHLLHCAIGMARKCTDLNITLTEEANICYIKSAIKAGFWTNKIVLTQCEEKDMPKA